MLGSNLSATNVTIQSSSGAIAGNGDIFVNDTVSWSANTLTLDAYRNIMVNREMNAADTASLALEYGQGASAAGNTAVVSIHATVNLPEGNHFSTKLGSDGTVKSYYVITRLGAAGSVKGTDLR